MPALHAPPLLSPMPFRLCAAQAWRLVMLLVANGRKEMVESVGGALAACHCIALHVIAAGLAGAPAPAALCCWRLPLYRVPALCPLPPP